ncbi:MAG: hypothetical protein E6Q78_05265 [Rhodoferax sp.]|nr:MAG: hypothetical protein E6Q78_05265 [Rhodoferax sp.]
MAHMRTQIRQALVAALTGLPATGARVFVNSVYELRASDLPCLLVQTGDEPQIDAMVVAGTAQQRQHLVMVKAVAKQASGLQDALDQMLLEVEGALALSTLGGLVKRMELKAIATTDSAALDTPVGELTATWFVTYLTPTTNPDTHL